VRTTPTKSVPRICFRTYPAAPTMTASSSAESPPNEVYIRHATPGIRERLQRRDTRQHGGRGADLAGHLDIRLG
jgi:hypothetical protein